MQGGRQMICTECGSSIRKNQTYYRLLNKGAVFCSKDCVHSAYKGFYSDKQINKGIRELSRR